MSGPKPFICALEHRRDANGKDNRSRVMREYYARFCENLGLKYPGLLDRNLGNTSPLIPLELLGKVLTMVFHLDYSRKNRDVKINGFVSEVCLGKKLSENDTNESDT